MAEHSSEAEQLRQLVERYQIGYRVEPEWGPDPHWQQRKVGFELELIGSAAGGSAQPPAVNDATLREPYDALRAVAAWVFDTGAPDVCIAIDDGRHRLTQEPRIDQWVIALRAHIVHCGPDKGPTDEGEQRVLDEVKRRLASLGASPR